MISPDIIQKAILEENLEGWLFYIFRQRDSIACRLLDIPASVTNTRPWIYYIPARGGPVKIIHRIEQNGLDHLPGIRFCYISHADFIGALKRLAATGSPADTMPDTGPKAIAVQYSESLPAISFLDHGSAELLITAGFSLCSSANLVQRIFSLPDADQLAGQQRAGTSLLEIIKTSWQEIREAFSGNRIVYEGDIQKLMLELLDRKGLVTDHPPVVAAGQNSASPHYCPAGKGKKIDSGEVVQFDIWAKEKSGHAVYADISWVGFTARDPAEVPGEAVKRFADLCAVRDGVVRYINECLASGIRPGGADTDRFARDMLGRLGYADKLMHRTGHSIDVDVHGSGVNLDCVEFPDERKLLDGSCFSVEPGIYGPEYGMRTEIDVYINSGTAIITGPEVQNRLLLLNG
ncbi:MAG: M24 family metallopeptidase [Spirochaetales bacterium]|nr:M24 family metallopeptidase [Spirochaetales bacterium]